MTTVPAEIADLTIRQVYDLWGRPGAPQPPAELVEWVEMARSLHDLIELERKLDAFEALRAELVDDVGGGEDIAQAGEPGAQSGVMVCAPANPRGEET